MHLINGVTHYLLLILFNLDILIGVTAINVFYRCQDFPIQAASIFTLNCSNPNEVIYVESAIIGFTPRYRADRNVFECPVTSDTCTKTTSEPSTLCDGHIECILAQRILLYDESGLQCNINETKGLSTQLGGNFINVNYSCISPDLCSPLSGYRPNGRFICSTPTVSTTVDSTRVSATASSLSFSTARNISKLTNFIHLNTNVTDATHGSYGSENSSDTPAATPSSAQETTVVGQNIQLSPDALPNKESQLGTGVIIGIIVAAVVLTFLLTALVIFICKRRKRLKNIQQEPEMPLTHRTFDQDTVVLYSSNNVLSSDMTPSHSPKSVVNGAQTTPFTIEQQYARIRKSDDGSISRQRSVYELAGEVVNYETVRSSSKAVNQSSNANENLTDMTQQKNVQSAVVNIEGNSNGNVIYGIVRKAQNRSPIKSDEGAEAETEEAKPRVLSMFPPVAKPRSSIVRRDINNCAENVTEKAKVARNMLENNGKSLSDIIEEVDWEQSNEVVLVDNTLYSG